MNQSTSTESTTTTEPTTSVEAKPNAGPQDKETIPQKSDSSPLTSLTRSSTDISSEILNEPDDELEHRRRVSSPPAAGRIHNHLLPTGWSCKYSPNTDEYSFEYDQNVVPTLGGIDQDEQYQTRNDTPTRDDVAQTSRRPTLHSFECNYGYHFPASPTSSMISELAKQVQKSSAPAPGQRQTELKMRQIGYGRHKLMVPTENAKQARRLGDMFPTATQPVIEQMIQIYHGREGLIKAALISLGYKRATEYNSNQQTSAQSPIMLMMSKPASKKLFDKLVGYFPDTDETLIKQLMFRHKEVEHEIISALVEFSQDASANPNCNDLDSMTRLRIDKTIRQQSERNGAIMKLRYLKFLYPNCKEIELYHLLNCNDLNAQKVMELVEKRGHKRINIEEALKNRSTQAQQMRAQQAAQQAAKDKPPTSASDLLEAHVKRTKPNMTEARKSNLLDSLRKSLTSASGPGTDAVEKSPDESLALAALEAADFNEPLARRFIEEMQPVDEALFTQRYQMPVDTKPDVVAFPCKAVQKGDMQFMSMVVNENVYIERHIIECDHALALLKVDAATFTQEDFPEPKFTHRQGRRADLRMGPVMQRRQEVLHRAFLRLGANRSLQCGSNYNEICQDQTRLKPNTKAQGRCVALSRGRNSTLARGHNPALTQRTHPFFVEHVNSILGAQNLCNSQNSKQ